MEPCQDGTLREFTRLYKEYDSIFHSVALAVGLSDSALTVLYHTQELGDGCLQRDIAASAWVSKQTVHSTIRQLRERGLLSLSPGKGRDMHIHLTEEGRRLVREEIYTPSCRWKATPSRPLPRRNAGICCASPPGMWPPSGSWRRSTSAGGVSPGHIDFPSYFFIR